MYDELTQIDIKKMQQEIDFRLNELRPKLLADLQEARAHGDLSENYEYKTAKFELRKCDSRIRYLRKMIDTARIIKPASQPGVVGLFDKVEIFIEEEEENEIIQLMTTLREDSIHGIISKESPLGKALMGRRAGDRCLVKVSQSYSYWVKILSITKGDDDETLPISNF